MKGTQQHQGNVDVNICIYDVCYYCHQDVKAAII